MNPDGFSILQTPPQEQQKGTGGMTRILEASQAWERGYQDGYDDGTWHIDPEWIPNPYPAGTVGNSTYSDAYESGWHDGSLGIEPGDA